MENRKGSSIFLGVIGVATLIVAIIGATFAYFSASTNSANNAISTNSTTLSLQYNDTVGTKLSTNLIPATETIATYGAISQAYLADDTNTQCVDDNGNEVCSVYQFTVTNPSATTAQDITVTLKTVTNQFTNLKYKIYEGSVDDALDSDATPIIAATVLPATGTDTPLTALNQVLAKSGSKTYTMVLWIDDDNTNQTTSDAGKSFAAGLTITSGNGSGVTGVISGAQ